MNADPVLSMVGIAMKAGKAVSGEYKTENAVKTGKAYLAIIAKDASENTKKKFKNMCEFYEVPFQLYGSKDTLGHSIGKEFRASIAITDEGIAQAIMKKWTRRS